MYIQEKSYLIYLRQYLSLFGFNCITYSLKSSTSKRKSKNAFAENIKLIFVKKMQGFYKMQGHSMVSGDVDATLLSNLFN